jgi:hypothetical protein
MRGPLLFLPDSYANKMCPMSSASLCLTIHVRSDFPASSPGNKTPLSVFFYPWLRTAPRAAPFVIFLPLLMLTICAQDFFLKNKKKKRKGKRKRKKKNKRNKEKKTDFFQ